MSAGATTDRVLISLRQFLTSREIRPGERLDPAALARRFASSLTPLREALYRLTGEGLVESRAGGGFNLPALDTRQLRDRYAWSEQLLALAIHNWPRRRRHPPNLPASPESATIAEHCEALFLHIARRSTNGEHARAMQNLNATLHHARLAEGEVLKGIDTELEDMRATTARGDRRHILTQCANYHRRRVKYVNDIAQSINQST